MLRVPLPSKGGKLRGIYSSNRPGFLPQLFFAHAQIAPVFFPNFFSLTLKKIEFLAQTPLIITFYCIFKLQFFENCPKKLNFCPKIGKIRYVPVCFPIFVQMYRFCSPPLPAFLRNIYLCYPSITVTITFILQYNNSCRSESSIRRTIRNYLKLFLIIRVFRQSLKKGLSAIAFTFSSQGSLQLCASAHLCSRL